MTIRSDDEARQFDVAPVRGATKSRRERHVRDASLREWRVYERVCGQHDVRDVRLVFESDGMIRTLTRFPAEWRQLSDDELLALAAGPPRG